MIKYYSDAIRNYVNFTGKANRPQFWWFQLASFIIAVVLSLVLSAIASALNAPVIILLAYVYALFMLLPSLAIGARRLRDAGFSPWWLLLLLLSGLGLIILIILWCHASK